MNFGNTTFLLLLAEFESLHVKAETVTEKYLGLGKRECYDRANKLQLPFPTFRAESRKSPLMCDLRDVATWLDTVRQSTKKDWTKVNS